MPKKTPKAAPEQQSFFPPTQASPVLKWAGGKRQLLAKILEHVPSDLSRHAYHEPFVGGGAVFFAVAGSRKVKQFHLGDVNERLVRTYRGLVANTERVIDLLSRYPHTQKFFLDLRAKDIDARPDTELAAWMIYLNKTGFNGLYRVNSKNIFNVPFGRYAKPNICDKEGLREAARVLESADLRCETFAKVESRAEKGDFVYFDPPYVPVGKQSFVSYTESGFGKKEHEALAETARKLKQKGVKVLLSNADTEWVRELYEGFQIEQVMAMRNVNSKGSERGAVAEVLIS